MSEENTNPVDPEKKDDEETVAEVEASPSTETITGTGDETAQQAEVPVAGEAATVGTEANTPVEEVAAAPVADIPVATGVAGSVSSDPVEPVASTDTNTQEVADVPVEPETTDTTTVSDDSSILSNETVVQPEASVSESSNTEEVVPASNAEGTSSEPVPTTEQPTDAAVETGVSAEPVESNPVPGETVDTQAVDTTTGTVADTTAADSPADATPADAATVSTTDTPGTSPSEDSTVTEVVPVIVTDEPVTASETTDAPVDSQVSPSQSSSDVSSIVVAPVSVVESTVEPEPVATAPTAAVSTDTTVVVNGDAVPPMDLVNNVPDPATPAQTEVEKLRNFGASIATVMAMQTIEDYVVKMKPKVPVDDKTGGANQANFFRAVTFIINRSQDDFTAAFTSLLHLFEKHAEGAFHPRYINRFMHSTPLNKDERTAHSQLVDFLRIVAPVQSRQKIKAQVDHVKALSLGLSEHGRERVKAFLGLE